MKWLDQVEDNKDEKRFEVHVDGKVAFAEYILRKGYVVYPHTLVPEEIGGQGIGEALATYAMQYARGNDLQVKPYCPFIARFMKDNFEQYGDLLVEGFRLPS